LGYFIWYGFGRFFLEGLREDSLAFDAFNWLAAMLSGLWAPMEWLGFEPGALDASLGDVRASQLLSLLIVIVAVGLLFWRRSRMDVERYNLALQAPGETVQKATSEATSETSQEAARTPKAPSKEQE
jgi:phosphatidylglycerol:prolipoprotein diacylglycerol transferase